MSKSLRKQFFLSEYEFSLTDYDLKYALVRKKIDSKLKKRTYKFQFNV